MAGGFRFAAGRSYGVCLMGGFGEIARVFLGGTKPLLGDYWHQVVLLLARFALAWAVLIHLRRHRIFLRL
ncbi:MAG: hypothetical protein FJ399_17125 [Verrucomicrobia bacterium]|nr:hypothetical protein [Verrucomicrobiota bacterium]